MQKSEIIDFVMFLKDRAKKCYESDIYLAKFINSFINDSLDVYKTKQENDNEEMRNRY